MQAAEARLHQLDQSLCPYCDYRVERDFIRCPSCLRKLKERCTSCSRPLDQAWTICPYCEADVPGISSAKRSRRRRSAPAALETEMPELDGAIATEEESAEEPAALASESSPLAGEPTSLAAEPSTVAPEPAVRPRGGRARRPRPTS
jgi:hypothetical protein